MFKSLEAFYKSAIWSKFRMLYISQNEPICVDCKKIIVEDKDLHLHHIEELTIANVNDYNISLNPKNMAILCHNCHNKRHKRFGYGYGNRKTKFDKGIYLVYGAPLSGKKTFVKDKMQPGDLVIEMDLLYQAVSMQELYTNPTELRFNVFAIRNLLLDQVKTRYGKFNSAWIIGGYADRSTRERLAKELGAETVFIESTKEECLARLNQCKDYRATKKKEFQLYIDKWFEEFVPSPHIDEN